MPRINLWNYGMKGSDFKFQDGMIREHFNMSGTGVYVHLYEGVYDENGDSGPLTQIQDVVFAENRDRKYSNNVYELRGCYTVQENNFSLAQFGLLLGAEDIFIEFHMNDMLDILGRRFIPGDVIELPHLRDTSTLDGRAINKFYVVEDSTKAQSGYGTTWLPHIWRIKVTPMTNSSEYNDILNSTATDPFGLATGSTLGELLGTLANDLDLNEQVVDQATEVLMARNFETRQFYVVPGDGGPNGSQFPWVFAGDGIPPDGAQLVGSGESFPTTPSEGDYYLRTDYSPNTLFMRTGGRWVMQEQDYRRGKWNAAERLLDEFLNITGTTTLDDGTAINRKAALSKLLKPDF